MSRMAECSVQLGVPEKQCDVRLAIQIPRYESDYRNIKQRARELTKDYILHKKRRYERNHCKVARVRFTEPQRWTDYGRKQKVTDRVYD